MCFLQIHGVVPSFPLFFVLVNPPPLSGLELIGEERISVGLFSLRRLLFWARVCTEEQWQEWWEGEATRRDALTRYCRDPLPTTDGTDPVWVMGRRQWARWAEAEAEQGRATTAAAAAARAQRREEQDLRVQIRLAVAAARQADKARRRLERERAAEAEASSH